MNKFYGVVGYAESVEEQPAVWKSRIVEKKYYGDVRRNIRKWESGDYLTDDLNVNVSISIVADGYAYSNFHSIKYVEWLGRRWKVTSVEVARPRLILTVGGVYNGDIPDTDRHV